MLHEHVETDILREVVAVCGGLTVFTNLVRIDLHLNLPLMRIIGMCDKETWHRESLLHDVLGILKRSLEQLFKVFIARIIMVPCLFPLVNGVTFPDANVEESV